MPRATRNRRRVPNTVNPESMELGQLLALPRQSLVLLASARHLVTTGSKAQLAERIHGFEHATPPPAAPIPAPNNATRLTVNVDETTGPATAFSEMQISQLRSLISAAVHNERVAHNKPRFWSEGHYFLQQLRTLNLLRRPSTLVHKISTLRSSLLEKPLKMAPLHPQHLVPIPQQPTSWERLALLLLPTIFHLSRKKSYSGSSNVSTLIF